jgi:hypothetical protein
MKQLVDGVGKSITLGDMLLYKSRHSWRYAVITGIRLKYGQYTITVYMANKYYSVDDYFYSTVGLTSSKHIYKSSDIPDKVKSAFMRKVIEW